MSKSAAFTLSTPTNATRFGAMAVTLGAGGISGLAGMDGLGTGMNGAAALCHARG
jgi:hypothetical protein